MILLDQGVGLFYNRKGSKCGAVLPEEHVGVRMTEQRILNQGSGSIQGSTDLFVRSKDHLALDRPEAIVFLKYSDSIRS